MRWLKELAASLIGGAIGTIASIIWGNALIVGLSLYNIGTYKSNWKGILFSLVVFLIYAYWIWKRPSIWPAILALPSVVALSVWSRFWPLGTEWSFAEFDIFVLVLAQLAALFIVPVLKVFDRVLR
jgi:hypothetical protein